MQIDVYDTYATSKQGAVIHFDVFVERGTGGDKAFEYARKWLAGIGEDPQKLDQSHCRYCHSEHANPVVQGTIKKNGYYILQMEGCPEPVV